MEKRLEKENPISSASALEDREALLIETFRVLSSDLDLDAVIKNSLKIVIKRLGAEAACLFLTDLYSYKLKSCCSLSDSPEQIHILPLENENQIPGWVKTSRKPYILKELSEDSEFSITIKKHLGFNPSDIIGIPL